MTQPTARPYAGAADLQRMETALAQGYGSTSLRVGDLSWLSREHSHRELSLDIRLWEDGNGQLVAWTYFRPNGEFNAFVMPGTGLAQNGALYDEMLEFVHDAARTSVLMGDPPVTLVTYPVAPARSPEDRALAAALERSGYRIDQSPSADSGVLSRSLDDVPEPVLPHGYRLDWVATQAHVVGHVEAHRAASAPSDLSVRKYQRVRRTWAYRPTLDPLISPLALSARPTSSRFTGSTRLRCRRCAAEG